MMAMDILLRESNVFITVIIQSILCGKGFT